MSSRHFSCLFCRFRGDTVANVFQQHRGFRCSAIACEFACCLCCLLALCSLMGAHIFNRFFFFFIFFFYNILNTKNKQTKKAALRSFLPYVCVYISMCIIFTVLMTAIFGHLCNQSKSERSVWFLLNYLCLSFKVMLESDRKLKRYRF